MLGIMTYLWIQTASKHSFSVRLLHSKKLMHVLQLLQPSRYIYKSMRFSYFNTANSTGYMAPEDGCLNTMWLQRSGMLTDLDVAPDTYLTLITM